MNQNLTVSIGWADSGLAVGARQSADALNRIGTAAQSASGTYVDAAGRMRAANGQFITSAQQLENAVGGSLGNLSNIAGQIGSKMKSLGTSLSRYVTTPLLLVGGGALKMAGDMEKASVSFGVMLGSAAKAKTVLAELTNFAATTPFELPEVQAAAKSLLAFGISADQLTPTLRSIGDISAGIDAPIGEIATIFGKARVQGRLFAEDINQLTGRGIPIIQQLAKQFGVTDGAVKKLVEDGRVNFGNLQQAFTDLTATGSQFGGLMAAQSQTLPGLISNFTDNAGQSLAGLGKDLIDAFDIKGLLQRVSGAIGNFTKGFAGLDPAIKKVVFGIAAAAAVVGPLLVAFGGILAVVPAITAGFAVVSPILAGLGAPFLLAAGAIGGAVYLMIKNWDTVKAAVIESGAWTTVVNLVKAAGDAIGAIWTVATNKITEAWNDVKGYVIPVAQFIASTVGNIFNTFGGVLTGVFKTITGVLTGDWGKLSEGLQNITVSIWNGIITAFTSGIGLVGRLFSSFLNSLGATDFSKSVLERVDKIVAGANKAKVALQNSTKIPPGGITLEGVEVRAKRTVVPPPKLPPAAPGNQTKTDTGTQKEINQLTVLKQIYERLGTQIELNAARGKKSSSDLINQWSALGDEIERVNAALKRTDLPEVKELPTAGANASAVSNALTAAQGKNPLPKNLGTLKAQWDVDAKFQLDDKAATFNGLRTEIASGIASLSESMDFTNFFGQSAQKQLAESATTLQDSFRPFLDTITAAKNMFAESREQLKSGALNVFAGIFESIGASKNPLQSALAGILSILGDYLIKQGTAMLLVAQATSLAALIPGIGLAFAPTASGSYLAAGALIAGGGLVKGLASSLPKAANGAVLSSPQMLLAGEYPGADRNRELVTPENLMKKIVTESLVDSGMAGGGGGTLSARISGNDLLILMERAGFARDNR